jgi:aminoglycoside phosphotransferase (APT) family kinase protein
MHEVSTILNPTIDVRPGEELDGARVDRFLKAHVEHLSGTPVIKQFPSGNSNLTYSIAYPNRPLVLRCPPRGTKPKSGHSMVREYRIMTALKPVFPTVPPTLLHSDDESVLGREFYVMDYVEGHVIHREIPPDWRFTAADCRRLCLHFWDRLIALHGVDYSAIGLADFGRAEGYVARQIHGWDKRFAGALTPDVDEYRDIRDWLMANIPAKDGGGAVLHGDFRIDNALLDPADPTRIRAILDWEISALGDPLMDLGNALAYWVEAGDPAEVKARASQPSLVAGMLTRSEILDYYADKTGRPVPDFRFYLAQGQFRLMVILQQIYYRYFHGETQDERFAAFRERIEALGRGCLTTIESGTM